MVTRRWLFARTSAGRLVGLTADIQQRTTDFARTEQRWSEAEQAVIRETRARLERAIARVCPPQLASAVDDIVQVAMLRVMRSMARAHRGEGIEAPAASYLWKVAYTTMVDELRKMQSRQRVRGEAGEVGTAASGLSPDAAVAGSEISGAIRACLAGLSENRRRAVVLHLLGHSVPETGSLLGWDRKRAENLVYRGLADLRRCLAAKGFEP